MNGDFVEQLVKHTRPDVVDVRGQRYVITPAGAGAIMDPQIKAIEARSLSAIVDFMGQRKDLFVHVESPTRVCVLGEPGPDRARPCFMVSQFVPPFGRDFFGTYHDAEPFVIALQSTFQPTEDLAVVLKVAGTLSAEAVVNLDDDGVSQKATVRQGIALKAEALIRNPVRLAPYRTFTEVAQPESAFILRLRGGGNGDLPKCALIVADGNAWQLDAMQRIKGFLTSCLPGVQIIA